MPDLPAGNFFLIPEDMVEQLKAMAAAPARPAGAGAADTGSPQLDELLAQFEKLRQELKRRYQRQMEAGDEHAKQSASEETLEAVRQQLAANQQAALGALETHGVGIQQAIQQASSDALAEAIRALGAIKAKAAAGGGGRPVTAADAGPAAVEGKAGGRGTGTGLPSLDAAGNVTASLTEGFTGVTQAVGGASAMIGSLPGQIGVIQRAAMTLGDAIGGIGPMTMPDAQVQAALGYAEELSGIVQSSLPAGFEATSRAAVALGDAIGGIGPVAIPSTQVQTALGYAEKLTGVMQNDLPAGFDATSRAAVDMGQVLYGGSVLTDTQEHLREIIRLLGTMEDKFVDASATAQASPLTPPGGPPPGIQPQVNPQQSADIGDAIAKQLIATLGKEGNTVAEAMAKSFQMYMSQNIEFPAASMKRGAEAAERAGVETSASMRAEAEARERAAKNTMLRIKGIWDLLATAEIARQTGAIMELGQGVNNVTGATMGTVAAAREYQHQTTRALENIRQTGGFAVRELAASTDALFQVGVTGEQTFAKEAKSTLYAARALGEEVGTTTAYLSQQTQTLMAGSGAMDDLAGGAIRVGRETGKSAKSVMEIQRGLQQQIVSMRSLGALSTELVAQLTRIQIISQKLGVEPLTKQIQEAFSGIEKFDEGMMQAGALLPMITSRLSNMGIAYTEFATGSLQTTVQGQRDMQKATFEATSELMRMAASQKTAGEQALFLQSMTRGQIKSMDELRRLNQAAEQGSMTMAQRVEKLTKVQEEYNRVRATAGEQAAQALLPSLAGDPNVKSAQDLMKSIADARAGIGREREQAGADVWQRMQPEIARLMSAGSSYNQALTQAFEANRASMRGELEGITDPRQIQKLSEQNAKRNADAVQDGSKAATQNMTDQVAQGVERGMQMVAGPFVRVMQNLESMGLGPLIGAIGTLSTAAIALSASSSTFGSAIGGIRGLIKMAGAGGAKAAAGAAGTVATAFGGQAAGAAGGGVAGTIATTFGGQAAGAAGAAGNAATAATGMTGAMNQATPAFGGLGNAAQGFGDSMQSLWQAKGQIAKGAVVLVAVGVAMGLAMRLIGLAMPPADDVMDIAKGLVVTTVAFGVLGLALSGMAKGMQLLAPTATTLGPLLTRAGGALLIISVAAMAIGGTLWVLDKAMPDGDRVMEIAGGLVVTTVAFGVLGAGLYGLSLGLQALAPTVAAMGPIMLQAAVGLLALAVAGTAIGGAIRLIGWAMGDPKVAQQTAIGLILTSVAFGALVAALVPITAVGLLLTTTLPLTVVLLAAAAVGLLALAVAGAAIGLAMRGIAAAMGDPQLIMLTALALTATSIALIALSAAVGVIAAIGVAAIFGGAIAMAAIGVGVAAMAVAGVAMMGAIALISAACPDPKKIEETSQALGAAGMAFGKLAVAMLGLAAVGLMTATVIGPALGAVGLTAAVGAALAMLAAMKSLTLVVETSGLDAATIEKTSGIMSQIATAFKDLSAAASSLVWSGAGQAWGFILGGGQTAVGNVAGLRTLMLTMLREIGNIDLEFQAAGVKPESIKQTANTMAEIAGAFKNLAEASANLGTSVWDWGEDNRVLGMQAMGKVATVMIAGMIAAQAAFAGMPDIDKTAKAVTTTTEAFKTLGAASKELSEVPQFSGKRRDEQRFSKGMDDLTSFGVLMANKTPDLIRAFPQKLGKQAEDTATAIRNVSQAMIELGSARKTLGEAVSKIPRKGFFGRGAPVDEGMLEETKQFGVQLAGYMKALVGAYEPLLQQAPVVQQAGAGGPQAAAGVQQSTSNMVQTIEAVTKSAQMITAVGQAREQLAKIAASEDMSPEDITKAMGKVRRFANDLAVNVGSFGRDIEKVGNVGAVVDSMRQVADMISVIGGAMEQVVKLAQGFAEQDMTIEDPGKNLVYVMRFGQQMSGGISLLNDSMAWAGESGIKDTQGRIEQLRGVISSITLSMMDVAKASATFSAKSGKPELQQMSKVLVVVIDFVLENKDRLVGLSMALAGVPKDLGQRAEAFKSTINELRMSMVALDMAAQGYVKDGQLDVKGFRQTLVRQAMVLEMIPQYITPERTAALSAVFSGIDPSIASNASAMAKSLQTIPEIFSSISAIDQQFKEAELERFAAIMDKLADVLAPLKRISEALSFKAPDFTEVRDNMAGLRHAINAAGEELPTLGPVAERVMAEYQVGKTMGGPARGRPMEIQAAVMRADAQAAAAGRRLPMDQVTGPVTTPVTTPEQIQAIAAYHRDRTAGAQIAAVGRKQQPGAITSVVRETPMDPAVAAAKIREAREFDLQWETAMATGRPLPNRFGTDPETRRRNLEAHHREMQARALGADVVSPDGAAALDMPMPVVASPIMPFIGSIQELVQAVFTQIQEAVDTGQAIVDSQTADAAIAAATPLTARMAAATTLNPAYDAVGAGAVLADNQPGDLQTGLGDKLTTENMEGLLATLITQGIESVKTLQTIASLLSAEPASTGFGSKQVGAVAPTWAATGRPQTQPLVSGWDNDQDLSNESKSTVLG